MERVKKVALVTGANRGIGLEVARQLGEMGMVVLMGGRSYERVERSASGLRGEGIEAYALHVDVTDKGTIERAGQYIDERYEVLDVLVNNAAVARLEKKKLPSEVGVEDMRSMYETNVFGTLAVTQRMIPLLSSRSGGRIVNLSSGLASLGTISPAPAEVLLGFGMAYSSAKTALNAMTIFLAKELEQYGVKVNAVDPGATATEMNPQAKRTVQEAARLVVCYATLQEDGPTGGFFGEQGVMAW